MDTSRVCWIGTSWKMNKTIAEARDYVRELLAASFPAGVQPFVLPPLTALAAVRDEVAGDPRLLLGAQNAHWAPEGPGTGEVSMRMVADAGAALVEIGHSERRSGFGETDETVARKVRAALAAGLTPLVCVGEPSQVRDQGVEVAWVEQQVRAALRHVPAADVARVLLAYEPVWAIGSSGRSAVADELAPVMAAVADLLRGLSGGGGARGILYGGGVDRHNAAQLLAMPHTDGLFVGRAAWSAAGLLQLVNIGGHHVGVKM